VLGLGREAAALTLLQVSLRGVIVFAAALVIVRCGDRRFLSQKTAFDAVLGFMLASMLALLVGAIMLLAGVAKLGFIADLLSKPTQIGYMNGLALTILVGQLPKLFGFSVDADGFLPELKAFVLGVTNGDTVVAALAVGVGSSP